MLPARTNSHPTRHPHPPLRSFPMRLVLPFVLLGGLAAVSGCARGPNLVPVSGRVTLDGKPVTEMIVNFTPLGSTEGTGAIAGTDGDGRYTARDARGGQGAHAGEYMV